LHQDSQISGVSRQRRHRNTEAGTVAPPLTGFADAAHDVEFFELEAASNGGPARAQLFDTNSQR
jgi:hypothetical protein